jgi:glucose/mannose-6-phosphate isomerase
MADLKALLEEYDKQGMYKKITEFPSQLEEGFKIGRQASKPDIDVGSIKNVVVCGLGGSAIGGDLVRTFLTYDIKVPFQICRHYDVPEYVDQSTLCILSSYSGTTEETLSAYADSKQRGAQIIAITTGGELKKKAESDGFSVITIPPGFPPRAALGFSFMPLLVILYRLGFCPDLDSDTSQAIDFLRENVKKYFIDKAANPAIQTAQAMFGRIPIIYGGQDYFDAVAVRFKGQICENAKQLAFFNFFPEFNHNELVGWGLVEDFRDKLYTIIIKDKDDHKRVGHRMKIVADIIRAKGVEVRQFETDGPNLLARIFSAVQFGDFVSLYLALLNKIDPTPVEVIDYLKGELAKL